MPNGFSASTVLLNARGDSMAAIAKYLDVMGGDKPGDGDVAITDQPRLVRLQFSGFEATTNGVLRAALIGALAIQNGEATWYRVHKTDGTTGLWDGTVGDEDSDADMIVRTTRFSAGVLVGPISFEHDLRGDARSLATA